MEKIGYRKKKMKEIKILGAGCPKCQQLAENAKAAAESAGVEYELEKVTNLNEIMKFGVMMTPALVIDGQVKVVGKVPDVDAIRKLLT
jgi:small redox-active disulfide protein 2